MKAETKELEQTKADELPACGAAIYLNVTAVTIFITTSTPGLAISDAFDTELAEVHHIAWKELREHGEKPVS